MSTDSHEDQPIVSVHWYRHGLRLHDNPSLHAALDGAAEFYPIFIFDGESAGMGTAKFPRMRFLIECLQDLDRSYQKLGGRLYCFKGKVTDVFTRLIEEWGINRVTFEQDPEPVWLARDDSVKALLEKNEVEWIELTSHTLWDPSDICGANGGRPPHTFQLFCEVAQVLGHPERPKDVPDFSKICMPVSASHEGKYGIPSLESLGIFPESDMQRNPINRWHGGETEGLKLFGKRIEREKKATYCGISDQLKPDLLGQSNSLSPHLRFGTLSVRRFYWALQDRYDKIEGNYRSPQSLTAQLTWREFFYCMSYQNLNFGQIEDNPICLQINWNDDEEKLKKWNEAKTGFPWIDAILVQLKQEGWVHHVARHALACFLTRGDLWCSWVAGFKHMEQYLLDGDWSICAGNWMWVSSSAFENCLQCPNCFSPITFGMRMEPTGEYIRRYLPVLKDFPLKYLYSPWKAPLEEQKKAKCIIGEDYPFPMVDHQVASKQNKMAMESIKAKLQLSISQYCSPSNEEEIQQFLQLPMENEVQQKRCTSNESCLRFMT